MKLTISEMNALYRDDFCSFIERSFYELNSGATFQHNWHIEVIAAALEDCRQGRIKRLIINIQPRSLKSHCASVAFPAFLLGHKPAEQVIAVSYGQDLANTLASDCRTLMSSSFYQSVFPTRLSPSKQAVNEFRTTKNGFRLATSVGGGLMGRGSNFIIIDDPLKPDQACSETERKSVNQWYLHTLSSRLNDKRTGCIIIIMQRLHEDDLVGHVLGSGEQWKVLRFPAIAEEDEVHTVLIPGGLREFRRRAGEALQPEREPLEVLNGLRERLGEYNFAGQYQQSPTPFGGGMVKPEWFKLYKENELPAEFEQVIQSWDTANKPSDLSDFSVCTTWGLKQKKLYLIHVFRKRLDYPALKRAVQEQAQAFRPRTIIIEDKASGTQLIQDLINEGIHSIKKYETKLDKIMRMHSVSNTIENGFVYLPERAPWLADYEHELAMFPNGKFDDQVDSTSQALDWYKQENSWAGHALLEYYKREIERMNARKGSHSGSTKTTGT